MTFNIGDRVTVHDTTDYYTEGDTGTVGQVEPNGDLWVKFDEDNYHSYIRGWNDRYWCVDGKTTTLLVA